MRPDIFQVGWLYWGSNVDSVSSLVLLAGYDDEDTPSFESIIQGQIKTLRKQLDKSPTATSIGSTVLHAGRLMEQSLQANIRSLLDGLSESYTSNDSSQRIYTAVPNTETTSSRSYSEARYQRLLDALSDEYDPAGLHGGFSNRIYTSGDPGSADSLPIPGSMPTPRRSPSLIPSRIDSRMLQPLPPSP